MSVEIRKIANKTLRFATAASLAAGLAGGQDAKAGNPQEEVIRAFQQDTHTLIVENPNTINTIGTLLNTVEDTASQEQQPEPEPTPSITLTPVGPSNIRSGPSTQSEIVGSADVNRQISALGYFDAPDGYRWYYFRTDKGGGWIREDRVRDPNEDVETIPNLGEVLDVPVLNPDGSPSNKKLLETNVNLALVNLAFKNIREAGFPEGTTNPSNIALLGQKEDSLVFIQTNPIERPGGGINEAGSIFTIDIDEGELITKIGFFGLGQIKDIAASYEIDLREEDMFSVEEMPGGFVRIGDNMIFYWRGAVEKLIEGLSQEEAISQNLIQITGGELSGRSFTKEENMLILSDGSTAEIDFENGIGKVQIPEVQKRQETEEDYEELESQPVPLPLIRSHTLEEIGLNEKNFNKIFTRDKMITLIDGNAFYGLSSTYDDKKEVRNVIERISTIPSLEALDFNGQPFIGVWEINNQIDPHNIEFFVPATIAYITGITELSINTTPNGGRPDERINFLNIWIPLTPDGASVSLILQMRKFYVRGWGNYRDGPGVGVSTDGLNGFLNVGYHGLTHYELDHGTIMKFIQNNIGSQVLLLKGDSVSEPRGEYYNEMHLILIDLFTDGKLDNPSDYPIIKEDNGLYNADTINWEIITSEANFNRR